MIWLGIDVSSRKLAIAGIRESGSITYHAIPIAAGTAGARRLREARDATWAVMGAYRDDGATVTVEIPWASSKGGSSFVLLSIAAVALEASQAAIPGAVVMDVPTSSWKMESVGYGNASKDDVMRHAAGLGYAGADQDVADALCIAQCGMERWLASDGAAA